MESFKSKKTITSSVALLVGLLFAFSPVFLPILLARGGNLPPFLFPLLFLAGIGLILTVLLFFFFGETGPKHRVLFTTLCSLGISAAGAFGWVCFQQWFLIALLCEMDRHPIRYPCALVFGIASFFVFIFLLFLYVLLRKDRWSCKRFLFDFATTLLCAPGFFMLETYAVEWLSRIH